jgi:glutamyl-tRNA synthetase
MFPRSLELKRDADIAEIGQTIRLMELFNFKIESVNTNSVEASFASGAYEEARKAKAKLIHWIPKGTEFPCQVVMPDATITKGIAESACKKLKPDTVIQFERFGFVRIDQAVPKLKAYFAHK